MEIVVMKILQLTSVMLDIKISIGGIA